VGSGVRLHYGFLPENGVKLQEEVRAFETDLILQALERTDGNQSAAARLLNVKRTTMVEKMKRLGIA